MILNDNEKLNYSGGAKITVGVAALISAIGAFVFGIVDGILNPIKCRVTR